MGLQTHTVPAQAPGGRCLDIALQLAPDGTEQPSAWLLTDEALHVVSPETGLSTSTVLSDAALSASVEDEPDAQVQVGSPSGNRPCSGVRPA